MCRCMEVSKSSYYYWLKRKGLKPQKSSLLALKNKIIEIYQSSNKVYGSKRIEKALELEGLVYSASYIAVVMKQLGIKSVLSKKFRVTTTNSNHSYPVADNVLNRNFTSQHLGEKWVSDISYIKIEDKWKYLTTILDLADRKVVAWTLSEDMTTENTVYKTWLKATTKRKITKNHIFHSDRGIQYACHKMKMIFSNNNHIKHSMSRKANCWDNAVAESFFKTIKYECIYRYKFTCFINAYQTIEKYINWYNNKRLHSALQYRSPLEVEMEYYMKNKKVA